MEKHMMEHEDNTTEVSETFNPVGELNAEDFQAWQSDRGPRGEYLRDMIAKKYEEKYGTDPAPERMSASNDSGFAAAVEEDFGFNYMSGTSGAEQLVELLVSQGRQDVIQVMQNIHQVMHHPNYMDNKAENHRELVEYVARAYEWLDEQQQEYMKNRRKI
jgi:hypothetical protein